MLFNIREVFIRLQHENKMLRLQQEGTENERIEQLQEQLEQKHRKMNELETEQRWLLPFGVKWLSYLEVGNSTMACMDGIAKQVFLTTLVLTLWRIQRI